MKHVNTVHMEELSDDQIAAARARRSKERYHSLVHLLTWKLTTISLNNTTQTTSVSAPGAYMGPLSTHKIVVCLQGRAKV